MSENNIAASRLKALIGCKASSQQTSGFLHISKKFLNFFLTFLYSGMYLPACRINQIGGVDRFSLFNAFNKRGFLLFMLFDIS